jgi:hypothetical protein
VDSLEKASFAVVSDFEVVQGQIEGLVLEAWAVPCDSGVLEFVGLGTDRVRHSLDLLLANSLFDFPLGLAVPMKRTTLSLFQT